MNGEITRDMDKKIFELELSEAQFVLNHAELEPERIFSQLSSFAVRSMRRVDSLLNLVDKTRIHNFTHVGCGPFPSTSFCIQQKLDNVDFTLIDIDQTAVCLAQQVCSILGVDRSMNFVLSDGCEFDFSQSDLIFVANLVKHKGPVIDRILKTAPAGVHLVIRNPTEIGHSWAEWAPVSSKEGLHPIGEGPSCQAFHSKDYHFLLKNC